MKLADVTTKVIGDKRRWWAYRARVKQLPEDYRMTVEAFQRYLMYFGSTDAVNAASMFEDLIDLFERAAVDQTPIRVVVGEDPIEFVEEFLANYSGDGWVTRERDRLNAAIDRAEELGRGTGQGG